MGKLFSQFILQNHFLTALVVVAFIWVALELRQILVILFIAFIVMSALSVFVDFLQKRHVPKVLAVFIPYSITLAIILVLIVPLIPFFIAQLQTLFANFPSYMSQTAKLLNLPLNADNLLPTDLNIIGKNALLVTEKLFNGVFSLLAILVLGFYFMLWKERINKAITGLFPKANEEKILLTIYRVENKLGAWLRGQIALSFVIGVGTWIALTILGLPSALPLALLAGILEIIPTIGPIISAIPAIIVALTISPATALIVVALYILIQMLENNFLVPKIMQRAVGLNPIIIIIGVMTGGKLMGALGALLSVPFIATLVILFQSFRSPSSKS